MLCGLFPSCGRQGSHCGRLSRCGAQNQQLRCAGFVAHIPNPGIKPVSPALAQSGTEMYLRSEASILKSHIFRHSLNIGCAIDADASMSPCFHVVCDISTASTVWVTHLILAGKSNEI